MAQTYVFAQLNGSPNMNTSGWNLTGNAFAGDTPGDADFFGDELVLTNNTTWQSGAVFYSSPINPQICSKWTVEFDFRIFDGNGADGLAFCFLSNPPTGFVNGGGMGIPAGANGLKIGFDTYNNCGGPNPELQIFSGVGYDECIAGIVKLENTTGNLNLVRNATYQQARITYNNGVIELLINNVLYLTANFTINFSGYMGFTASTGSLYDRHSIRNVVIYTEQATSDAGPNVAICSGESIGIGTGNNAQYVYNWSPATGLSATNVSNPIVTLTNTSSGIINQTYTVSTTLANNPGVCPTTDQVVVSVYPQFTTFLTDTVCDGGPYLFNGQSLSTSGIYTANLQSIQGCDSIVQLDLTISSVPALVVSDTAFCLGGTAIILPSGAANYVWSPNSGTAGSNGILTLTPSQNTSLTLTGFNNYLCSSTETVNITVFPIPDVDISSLDTVLCPGEDAELFATGAFNYLWTGSGIMNIGSPIQNLAPLQSGTFQVEGTSVDGCTNTATISIIVHPKPIINASPDTSICLGEQIQIQATGATNYNWNTGQTVSSFSLSPSLSQTFEVVGSNDFGCSDTASFEVIVHPNPTAEIGANPTLIYADDPTVQFTNNSSGASSSIWNFGNLEEVENNQSEFAYTFPASEGNYLIGLTVTNSFGCSDQDIAAIQVNSDALYYVPNAFTPDGNEFNNIFLPVFTSGFDPFTYRLSIYDRWGEVVFDSQDHTIGWDGNFKGKMSPSGIYTWKIEYKSLTNGYKNSINGHVQLLR
jgi:gliding motility-associated-like protein